MVELSERERVLLVRGDVAVVALRAVLNSLKPAQATNRTTRQQLQSVLAKQPNTGQQTLLSVVTDVTSQMDNTLTTVIATIEQSLNDIGTFSGEDASSDPTDRAVQNVLAGARLSSDFYRDKSDEELRKILGI